MSKRPIAKESPELPSLIIAAESQGDWKDWVGKNTALYKILAKRDKERKQPSLIT